MSANNYIVPSYSAWPLILKNATPTNAGVMSAADKAKLDSLTPGGGGGSVEDVSDLEITVTTPVAVASYTPTEQGNYRVDVFYRVITASTAVEIVLTFASAGGARTVELVDQTQAVDEYQVATQYFNAVAGTPIVLTLTAGTANRVFVSTTFTKAQ